ncbi:hypothetical protein QKW35_18985 [Pontibacterium granulatum]|uniref:hypothetical protein n=1 Tax=Pontibacterium granulatum TaxID=2036029 RepID=UPI00249C7AEB|nr:hypothetical protein [Pontibacterium granulatum]MDI3326469.1 hypothetical protein [Pontibacterium granulatum]
MKLQIGVLLLLFSGSLYSAELVLKNGKILKVDAEFGQASALVVDNGRIVAIGDESDVASHINTGTQVVYTAAILPTVVAQANWQH